MNVPDLDPEALTSRYNLLCRVLQASHDAANPQPALVAVNQLETLIQRELLELARLGSPDDFADIYLDFIREINRFREFCAYPAMAGKTVVAFGGAFSAGKSSLINALIGKNLMVTEVAPTTALPAYVLAGETDTIHALNLHRLRVHLSDEEFASLTHEESYLYGSQVGRALLAAFVIRRDFPWANLAFIDTPGYTNKSHTDVRTDADLANTQLNGAHTIVWVVSMKQGCITEEDLQFLARLDPQIPRIIALSHADLVTDEDRNAIMARITETLANRNLPVLGVVPLSTRPRQADLLAPLRAQLANWNQSVRPQRFTHRFKTLFTRYQRGLEHKRRATQWQLARINRIAMLTHSDIAQNTDDLKTDLGSRMNALDAVVAQLASLRNRFFGELKRAGAAVGIPLPEPHEAELLEPGCSNMLEQLSALREQKGLAEPDVARVLAGLCTTSPAKHALRLQRRQPSQRTQALAQLNRVSEPTQRAMLLRHYQSNASTALVLLTKPVKTAHGLKLLRRPARPLPDSLKFLQA